MGAGPIHALLHLETLPSLRDQVTAARTLRANLAASAAVSIGMFPGPYTPADEAWADAAAVVDAPCWGLYPHNGVIRNGLPYWLAMVDAAAAQLKAWFPRRRKWVAYLTHGYQVWGSDERENADIVDMNWRPVPIGAWEAVNVRARDRGFTPYWWAPCPPYVAAEAAEHVAVFRRVWGLLDYEPPVVVAARG